MTNKLPTSTEARRLREAGTQGEFECADKPDLDGHWCVRMRFRHVCSTGHANAERSKEDARLIAAAVNNFVELAERVEELQAALQETTQGKSAAYWCGRAESLAQRVEGLEKALQEAREKGDRLEEARGKLKEWEKETDDGWSSATLELNSDGVWRCELSVSGVDDSRADSSDPLTAVIEASKKTPWALEGR